MAKKLFIADRDFDHFRKGEVVELEDDDPYTRTGYLDEYDPEAAFRLEAEAPAAVLPETTVEPLGVPAPLEDAPEDDEGAGGGDVESPGGAG